MAGSAQDGGGAGAPESLDRLDRRIVEALQEQGRMPFPKRSSG
ncbi:MAG TPA: AsnC family protein [Gaiellaceae bacterium]|nr:AsnC family protein [Gaiellaceae bacterium]